jgi:hypothetical protein
MSALGQKQTCSLQKGTSALNSNTKSRHLLAQVGNAVTFSVPVVLSLPSWLTAAMNNHSPNLSGFDGGSALSGLACGALGTGSGDFAFAIFTSLSRL